MTEMTMETCTKCGGEFAHDYLYSGLCPWCTPMPETLQLTRGELKALDGLLYGTDFSDINPDLQAAAGKIHAALTERSSS